MSKKQSKKSTSNSRGKSMDHAENIAPVDKNQRFSRLHCLQKYKKTTKKHDQKADTRKYRFFDHFLPFFINFRSFLAQMAPKSGPKGLAGSEQKNTRKNTKKCPSQGGPRRAN